MALTCQLKLESVPLSMYYLHEKKILLVCMSVPVCVDVYMCT